MGRGEGVFQLQISIYEGLGTTVAEGEGGAGVGTALDAL